MKFNPLGCKVSLSMWNSIRLGSPRRCKYPFLWVDAKQQKVGVDNIPSYNPRQSFTKLHGLDTLTFTDNFEFSIHIMFSYVLRCHTS